MLNKCMLGMDIGQENDYLTYIFHFNHNLLKLKIAVYYTK